MNLTIGAISTCMFELKRMLTWQRIGIFGVLSLFPPLMIFFLLWVPLLFGEASQIPFFVFVLIFLVSVVAILSLLLWATTNIYSELEGKSWVFIASRPRGRLSILFGKYLAACAQAFAICQVAIISSILIALPLGVINDPTHLYFSVSAIFLLACLSYGAVFSLIGVMFYRRAMVIGAGYVIVAEFIIANIPAIIGKFTLRQHLQELGLHWIGFFVPGSQSDYVIMYGDLPDYMNLLVIFAITAICLGGASYVIQSREYMTGDET
jgi:hypothetical protein